MKDSETAEATHVSVPEAAVAATTRGALAGARPHWRRDLAVFLASQGVSLFGSSLVQYAIMWHLTLETRSGAMMSLMIILGFLPSFFLSPFAGVFADRHDRKRIMIIADGAIAAFTLILAVVFAAGWKPIGLLLLISAIRSAGQAFHAPAVGALLPSMVPPESLQRVNAINGSMMSALSFASPLVAGLLLGLAPFHAVLFIDVGTAAVAISLLVLFLKVPPHEKASGPRTTGYFQDLKLGFKYVREHRYLIGFFSYLALLFFLIAPSAFLTPLQTARTYGPEVWRLTAIEIAFSTGMMAGGALLAAFLGFKNRMATATASTIVMALCAVALGLAPPFWAYLGVMALFGVAIPYFNAPLTTLLQEHVEPDYLGRVFSINSMISSSMMPIGALIFGPLADAVRLEYIILGTGAALAVLGLGAGLNKRLQEMGRPKAVAAGAGSGAPGAEPETKSPADRATAE